MTTWVHGAEETSRVEEASRIMFGGSLDGVQERTLELLAKVVPVVEIDRDRARERHRDRRPVEPDGRRLEERGPPAVQQGGAYVNNVRITDGERRSAPPTSPPPRCSWSAAAARTTGSSARDGTAEK